MKYLAYFLITIFNLFSFSLWGLTKVKTLAVDFDDTLMFTNSKVYLFNKKSDEQIPLSTQEFAEVRNELGPRGIFRNYQIIEDDVSGTYRNFRDRLGKNLILEAIESTLKERPPRDWKGPAWDIVAEALNDHDQAQRVAIITARGHEPKNIAEAFQYLVKEGFFKYAPIEKNIFPVSSPSWKAKGMSTEVAKVEALSLLLDDLEAEVNFRKSQGETVRGQLVFIDDDRKNFEMATALLPTLMDRWRDLDIYVSFVGAHIKDLPPQSIKIEGLPKDHSLCVRSLSPH